MTISPSAPGLQLFGSAAFHQPPKPQEKEKPQMASYINLRASAPKDKKTLVAAACFGAGMSDHDAEKYCKGADLDAARDLRCSRISDIFAALGYNYRVGDEVGMASAVRAAFSSSDIPNVLSGTMQKFVLRGFGAVGEQWREICHIIPVHDFKSVKGVRLILGGKLQPVGKGGELQHVDLADEGRDIQAATKGSIVGITREDLINDDLGVLASVPEHFGQMAGRTINSDVFGALSTTAADYGANTTGALSLDNLATAYGLAMGIKDANGDPLGALPDRILCSPSNFVTAKNIYLSDRITGAQSKTGEANTLRGVLQPLTSPYLDGTAYWLFNSLFPLVDAAFLNGNTEPTIETAQADFATLGISVRCYYDYGVGAGDCKAALYSTGA